MAAKTTAKLKQQMQHNKKLLLESLEKSLGVVTTACKSAGLDRTTFYRYVNEDPAFAEAVKDIENIALDFVESKFHQQISRGDTTACIFYLKTKGKHRGYVERTEHTGKDGKDLLPQQFIVEVVNKNDGDGDSPAGSDE